MKTLELRGLDYNLKKVNTSRRREIFYNQEKNNIIIFTPCDKTCDTDSICNGIADDMYNYLINELNIQNNIIVSWSQIEGTTSDYNIYYDMDNLILNKLTYKEIINALINQTEEHNTMKYNKIVNGHLIPILRSEF